MAFFAGNYGAYHGRGTAPTLGGVTSNFDPNYSSFVQQIDAAQTPSILAPTQYHNPGNLVHNNLPNQVRQINYREYTITFDSSHRDVGRYPNPYEYVVNFNPSSIYTLQRPKIGPDGMTVLDSRGSPVMETIPGEQAGPFVRESLKSVRFLRVEKAIMPRLPQTGNLLLTTEEARSWQLLESGNEGPYWILEIPELNNGDSSPCRFGTSQALSQAAAIMTQVDWVPGNWRILNSISPPAEFNAIRDFQHLTIRWRDSKGKLMKVPGMESCNLCRFSETKENQLAIGGSSIHSSRDLFPPPVPHVNLNPCIPNPEITGQTTIGGLILDLGRTQTQTTLYAQFNLQLIGDQSVFMIQGTLDTVTPPQQVFNLTLEPKRG
jgi:hypothetical protein